MDFYILLGLERGATLGDIKRAYRRLARKYHPDINPGDRMAEAQFRQIAQAYETLSDPDRRHIYDVGGPTGPAATEASFGFEGFDFSVSVGGASASTFGDLFAEMFQQRHAGWNDGAPERGADLHQTLTIPFEEALKGGQRQVTATRQERCRTCKGSGRLQAAESRCAHCAGSGVVKSARGHMVFSKPCPQCGGEGQRRETRCPTCRGQQVEVTSESLTIPLPAGLADGVRIRVAGKGHAGRHGGDNGDLYIAIQVQAHPLFRREGDELHMVVPVAIHEAALGARFDVQSFDGPVRLRVPPGSQSGQRFRIHERGIPSVRGGRPGDLVVEIRLVLPPLIDERSKELLREFGRINGDNVRSGLDAASDGTRG